MTVPARHRVADEGGRTAFVPRPGLERAVAAALDDGAGAQLVGDAGMGKTRLALRVLEGRTVLVASCATLRLATARDVLGALLQQAEPVPADLVHLLRGGSAGPGSTVDEQLLLRAAGQRIGVLDPPVTVLVWALWGSGIANFRGAMPFAPAANCQLPVSGCRFPVSGSL